MISWCVFRYVDELCFPLVRHLWCFCLNVCMICSRLCCAWMLGAEDLPLNVHVWRVHQCTKVHHINQVIIFSVGTKQFGTKFVKNSWKSFMCFRYMMMSEKSLCCAWMFGSWRFTSKCSCLKSAPVHQSAPDVLSLNFFSRHAAIRHKIYKEFMKIIDEN